METQNGIISKNYADDIKQIKQELTKIKSQSISQAEYQKSEQILKSKLTEFNQMDAKSKQLQDQITQVTQDIAKSWEKINQLLNCKNTMRAQL